MNILVIFYRFRGNLRLNGFSATVTDSGTVVIAPESLNPVRNDSGVTENPDGSVTVTGIVTIISTSGDETVISTGPDPGSTMDNLTNDTGTGLSIDYYNNHAMDGIGRTLLIEDDNGVPQVKSFTGFPEGKDGKFETDPLSQIFRYTDNDGNELILKGFKDSA